MSKQNDSIVDLVQEFLSRIAARTSTPGGGCVAAVNAAEAVSLLTMVARFSTEEFAETATKLEAAQQALLKLADEDIQAFGQVIIAWDSNDSTKKRDASLAAAEVPKKMLHQLNDILVIVKALAESGNQNLISDVGHAAHLLISAYIACDLNILVNRKQLTPDDKQKYSKVLQASADSQCKLHKISDDIRKQLEN
ncbi:MAG: cyclodeaminase/cyclohydrolase family protein [Pseudomonadales bacterium]